MYPDGVREDATPINQRVVDTRSVSQEGPAGVGGHALELGRHRNESAHVRTVGIVAEADATTPERGASKAGVGMLYQVE